MQITLAAVMAAGEFIGLQMGLGLCDLLFARQRHEQHGFYHGFLHTFAMLMYLALNVHLMMIEVLAFSFQHLPIGYRRLKTFQRLTTLARVFGSIVFLLAVFC